MLSAAQGAVADRVLGGAAMLSGVQHRNAVERSTCCITTVIHVALLGTPPNQLRNGNRSSSGMHGMQCMRAVDTEG